MRNNDFDCNERNHHECDEDFDFCEDGCDYNGYDRRSIRESERRNDSDCNDFDSRRRERDCECEERRCRCRDNDDNDRCRCRDNDDNDRCRCRDNDDDDEDRCRCREEECCGRERDFDGECCERTARCSDRRDFNEDERCGCNSSGDAAQSDDSWFDSREEECCMRTRQLCDEERSFCRKLKCRIQVLDFALQETILFLDTHPCDFEALRYYRIIRRKLDRLEKLYECKCGPLTNQGVDTEFGWEWATCPWPWEGRE